MCAEDCAVVCMLHCQLQKATRQHVTRFTLKYNTRAQNCPEAEPSPHPVWVYSARSKKTKKQETLTSEKIPTAKNDRYRFSLGVDYQTTRIRKEGGAWVKKMYAEGNVAFKLRWEEPPACHDTSDQLEAVVWAVAYILSSNIISELHIWVFLVFCSLGTRSKHWCDTCVVPNPALS